MMNDLLIPLLFGLGCFLVGMAIGGYLTDKEIAAQIRKWDQERADKEDKCA